MLLKEFIFLIKSDLYRYLGKISFKAFIVLILTCCGFKYSFWMRICAYSSENKFFRYWLYYLAKIILNHFTFKYGISIPFDTKIGSGLYIGHFGGIVVNKRSIIGKNCNISQGITIGQANRGGKRGCPVIGDNVFIGPGAVVIGNVKIGSNVAVGANCVVTKNIPDNAVVVGVPGEIISYKGSKAYIQNINYQI